MSKQVRADGILILVTLCWGVSYLLMDISLEELDPFTLNAFRFLGAFAIAALVSFKKIRTVNDYFKIQLLVGFALVFVYIGATFGKIYFSVQLGISLRADSGIHSHIGMAVF
ncbi:MAG: EamA family transporter [Oscillospiraceae bacterium]